MGANFNCYEMVGDRSVISREWASKQEEYCDEYGRDTYAGHIGIMPSGIDFVQKTFKDRNEAREYIYENHRKWDSAMATKFRGKASVLDAKSKNLDQRIEKLKKEIEEFYSAILKRIKSAKSRTIGCKGCGSSISRKHLRNIDCPICYNKQEFMTDTDKKRLKAKYEKLTELRRMPASRVTKTTDIWIVGGWCAE